MSQSSLQSRHVQNDEIDIDMDMDTDTDKVTDTELNIDPSCDSELNPTLAPIRPQG